ncbi:MAG: hypothetical protein Q4B70_16795, partial [Lachnospiraceae bacterium]|nr:hypothetical protein [Lachnospiraceae bacterium]
NFAPETPIENIKAAVEAIHTYGRFDATGKEPFLMPEVESFEEFLKKKQANNTEGYTFEWLEHSAYKLEA